MAKPLVIVESPAKAKTIAGFLGPDYVVESSIGHIRDLPRNAADVPPAYKGEPWARLGVDVDSGFKPLYVVSADRKTQVAKLKRLVKEASEVYLATDEDREGESIAWHLLEVLAPRVPVKRMVFHEITRQAIVRAVDEWRELDRRLVDAQEARRILDRLYGYEVSPLLWKKVMRGLSAGRVQSVATRVVVERERERMRFRSAGWWDLEATVDKDGERFQAALVSVDGTRVAQGRDFSSTGELATRDAAVVLGEVAARSLAERLEGVTLTVSSVTEKPFRRSPAPPFMTSTLQQEAGRKLRFSAQRAMQVAQRLYEQGYITYMRTDSTALSSTALDAARIQVRNLYGDAYVPDKPRLYTRKVKNAQEAHEAVRPAGDSFKMPEAVAAELPGDEARLYELIWKRTVASQMTDATGTSAQVRLDGSAPGASGPDQRVGLVANGKIISFPGFLRAYVEGEDDPEAELAEREVRLPRLGEGDQVPAVEVIAKGHETQPPARFTEASLVKAMEELGVGRPSTYASVIATIQNRGYVWKKASALVPSFTAFAVVGLLERYFPELVDYGFTASMEDDLDHIASGDEEVLPWLTRFYFGAAGAKDLDDAGNGQQAGAPPGLKRAVAMRLGEIDAREINSIPVGTDDDGHAIVVRVGRYGPYLQRGEERASIPEDLCPDEVTAAKAAELLAAPASDRHLGQDPETGLAVMLRSGRFGPYVQLGGPDDESAATAPKRASLFNSMSPVDLSLDDALRLLSLPRTVGTDPGTGEDVIAANGRFGPYVKRGTDTRSLDSEDDLFTITLDEALARLAMPKRRGGRQAAAPLRELGADPDSGAPIVLREGRFGPYVTDGTTNASLRRGDDAESVTLQRAAELLAERRAAGPSVRKASKAKKAPAKKAPAKKAPAKKAPAKKAPAKKAPAKKAHGT